MTRRGKYWNIRYIIKLKKLTYFIFDFIWISRTRLAAIRQTDNEIKKLVENLRSLERDTIIVFHSDNGATKIGCNYPYKGQIRKKYLQPLNISPAFVIRILGGKMHLTEGGTLSPTFIYRTKSRMPRSRVSSLMHITDWFPTLLTRVQNQNYHNILD